MQDRPADIDKFVLLDPMTIDDRCARRCGLSVAVDRPAMLVLEIDIGRSVEVHQIDLILPPIGCPSPY